MIITIKRIYDKPEAKDGYRMLVDRIWPRGLTKDDAALDEWNKDIAPSTELRKWYNHQPELFASFSKRYKEELYKKTDELKRIKSIASKQNLTLLYGAKDPHNQAAVLLDVLNQMH